MRDGVRPPREETRLGGRGSPFGTKDAAGAHALLAEILKKRLPRSVLANDRNRQHLCPQGGKIVGCVSAAAWNQLRLAMLQDQHRSLARNSRNVAITKFVGHKVTEENDDLSPELFYALSKIAQVHRRRAFFFGGWTLHRGCLKIQSTA